MLLLLKSNKRQYSECVFLDFVIQHANRMSHIIFPHVTCLTLPYSLYYFYTEILSKRIDHRMGFLVLFKKFALQHFPLYVQLTRYYDKYISVFMYSERYAFENVKFFNFPDIY
jgi:hypothetical protein